MKKIVLTGGGTAGHCTPNVALIPHLKNYFDEIHYIGSEKGIEKQIISNVGIPYYSIPTVKFIRKNIAKNIKIPFLLFSAIKKSGKILDKIKPDIVFSKGGYVSVPTVIAANKRGIPVICHESDYSLGLANKISSSFSNAVFTNFEDTAKSIKNGVFTGSPIRKFRIGQNDDKTLKILGFSGEKPVILVFGGSLGAKSINTTLRNSLPLILPHYDIIHITGKGNIDDSIKEKGYFQIEFTDIIDDFYSICSLVIMRAGSNSLFEVLSLHLPSVVIPLPKGNSRGDQIENAEYFYKKGLISLIYQKNLTPESLSQTVNGVYANRFNIVKAIKSYGISDASKIIAEKINGYIK